MRLATSRVVLDSQPHLALPTGPLLTFSLEGAPREELRRGREVMTLASGEGTVRDVTTTRLVVEGTRPLLLTHGLPGVDLRPLQGRRVRLSLREHSTAGRDAARTISIAAADGLVLLVAHDGPLLPEVHLLDGMAVSMALSQRRRGSLVVGTREGMTAVGVGERALLDTAGCRYGVAFLGHGGRGAGAYVLAHASLLAGAN